MRHDKLIIFEFRAVKNRIRISSDRRFMYLLVKNLKKAKYANDQVSTTPAGFCFRVIADIRVNRF